MFKSFLNQPKEHRTTGKESMLSLVGGTLKTLLMSNMDTNFCQLNKGAGMCTVL